MHFLVIIYSSSSIYINTLHLIVILWTSLLIIAHLIELFASPNSTISHQVSDSNLKLNPTPSASFYHLFIKHYSSTNNNPDYLFLNLTCTTLNWLFPKRTYILLHHLYSFDVLCEKSVWCFHPFPYQSYVHEIVGRFWNILAASADPRISTSQRNWVHEISRQHIRARNVGEKEVCHPTKEWLRCTIGGWAGMVPFRFGLVDLAIFHHSFSAQLERKRQPNTHRATATIKRLIVIWAKSKTNWVRVEGVMCVIVCVSSVRECECECVCVPQRMQTLIDLERFGLG